MLPEIAGAIEDIRTNFAGHPLSVREDGEGGCYVLVDDVPLGPAFQPPSTWIGFRITYTYPNADVYPHYVRGDLRRIDGVPILAAQPTAAFEGRPAMQISRRSNRWNPSTDSAVLKLLKVVQFLRGTP